jgi:hypothetical protein
MYGNKEEFVRQLEEKTCRHVLNLNRAAFFLLGVGVGCIGSMILHYFVRGR